MSLELRTVDTPLPALADLERAAARFDLPAVWAARECQMSAGGRWVHAKTGKDAAVQVLDAGSDSLESYPLSRFIGDNPRGSLHGLALHHSAERAAVVVSDLFGGHVFELDLVSGEVSHLFDHDKPFDAAWAGQETLIISGAEYSTAWRLGSDSGPRLVGAGKPLGFNLWAIAGGAAILGREADPKLLVAPVREGRIGKVTKLSWPGDEDPIVRQHEGRIILSDGETDHELVGLDSVTESFDPLAAVEAKLAALSRQAKKNFGPIRAQALREVAVARVDLGAERENDIKVLDAVAAENGQTIVVAQGELLILDGDAVTSRSTLPGLSTARPHPGLPTLIWTVQRCPEKSRAGVPESIWGLHDLSRGNPRSFQSWKVPIADGRLHVHEDAVYLDGGDIVLEVAALEKLLSLYRESWLTS